MAIALLLDPLDTLFFRDSRPFAAGEDSYAESTLPSPLTMYGAIGSYYLELRGKTLKEFMDTPGCVPELGQYEKDLSGSGFTIKGPFLCLDDEPYFPMPRNIWSPEDNPDDPVVLKPRQEKDSSYISNVGTGNHISLDGYDELQPVQGFVHKRVLETYLNDRLSEKTADFIFEPEESFVTREMKTGHALNTDSGTVDEGYLYSASHLKFHDDVSVSGYKRASLVVIVDSLSDRKGFPPNAFRIGGQQRGVHFSACAPGKYLVEQRSANLKKMVKHKRFFIYLATPAIFNDGWTRLWPSEFDDAKMVAAAVSKPRYVSGWQRDGDGMGGKPRSLCRTAPAGSVYFFEADNWEKEPERFSDLYTKYHFNESVSNLYRDAGFGISCVGIW